MDDIVKGKDNGASTQQMNRDRYATSKLLNLITAIEFARRFKEFETYVLDPGLMPGTGLARYQNRLMNFVWNNIMPVVGCFLPDTTSTKRSGKTAAWIMETSTNQSGEIISYNQKPYRYVWKDVVLNEKIGGEVYEDSMKIIGDFF